MNFWFQWSLCCNIFRQVRTTGEVRRLWVGYLRRGVMLLKIKATASKSRAPESTGDRTYQYPRALIFSLPSTAISAVAPPGGCKARINCIAMMEVATANGPAIQLSGGKKRETVTPTTAETTWPPMRFRGWERGLWMAP